MEDVEFSDEFCRFIQTAIPAVDAAELLILLYQKPEAWFTAGEAVGRLGPGISISAAQGYLELFGSRGLVASAEGRFQYRQGEHHVHVETLAQGYLQRPVTLIRVIYALRDSKIKSFADAFKLRKG